MKGPLLGLCCVLVYQAFYDPNAMFTVGLQFHPERLPKTIEGNRYARGFSVLISVFAGLSCSSCRAAVRLSCRVAVSLRWLAPALVRALSASLPVRFVRLSRVRSRLIWLRHMTLPVAAQARVQGVRGGLPREGRRDAGGGRRAARGALHEFLHAESFDCFRVRRCCRDARAAALCADWSLPRLASPAAGASAALLGCRARSAFAYAAPLALTMCAHHGFIVRSGRRAGACSVKKPRLCSMPPPGSPILLLCRATRALAASCVRFACACSWCWLLFGMRVCLPSVFAHSSSHITLIVASLCSVARARSGDLKDVKKLVEEGLDVNSADYGGRACLRFDCVAANSARRPRLCLPSGVHCTDARSSSLCSVSVCVRCLRAGASSSFPRITAALTNAAAPLPCLLSTPRSAHAAASRRQRGARESGQVPARIRCGSPLLHAQTVIGCSLFCIGPT